ncbi:MAG: hypothetical protein QXU98_04155 [Candidatus Parvarchaeota archaeon]
MTENNTTTATNKAKEYSTIRVSKNVLHILHYLCYVTNASNSNLKATPNDIVAMSLLHYIEDMKENKVINNIKDKLNSLDIDTLKK